MVEIYKTTEAPNLNKAIEERDWEETLRLLRDFPHLAEEELYSNDFNILWDDAPLVVIQVLLRAWPEAYEEESHSYRNLIKVKIDAEQWNFLDAIFLEFPQVLEMDYARRAAENGASLEFLSKFWKETGSLLYSVHNKDWEKCGELLREHPQLAEDHLSKSELYMLWSDAPLEIIHILLEAWPEAYNRKNWYNRFLLSNKLDAKQWDFLKSILPAVPNIITASDVANACFGDAPLDMFKLMLEKQPNAPREQPGIIFHLIPKNKLEHFRTVLGWCPAATDVKDPSTRLTPLLFMFRKKEQIDVDWIRPTLEANPNAAKDTDFDGKTPLHLSYQHGASSEIINMIFDAYPEAENKRDNLGRFPKDLSNQSEKGSFTPANDTLILMDKGAANESDNRNAKKKLDPDDAVVVCRGDILIRDPPSAQNEKDMKTYEEYSKQVLARHGIFETLLDEFSKMVGVRDKDVIQKAAAIQALVAQKLSNQNNTIINFRTLENPGYWYQQEVLKLVMRVYYEGLSQLDSAYPCITNDATFCMIHLERKKNGYPSPKPSDEHVKAYNELTQWLTEGFDDSSLYSMQGPVLKPLQSLFNKLFIRRGQTSLHVIGDMVRGTLLLDNIAMLDEVVKRIKNMFPNITENQFRHPDSCNGLADFLSYVHDDLKYLHDSHVLPYRFKVNSSQKKKEKPLWYNFNFFLHVPEYHRVGFSEMFVACELQIGLTEEINKHRSIHDAYERDRILSNQPLLKNYDSMTKEEEDKQDSRQGRFPRFSNCNEDDNKLVEKVLFGKIATDVLIPCATTAADGDDDNDDNNNILLFENGPFSLAWDEIEAGSFVRPGRLCLNNRSFNWFAFGGHKKDYLGNVRAALNIAGPFGLDKTKQYFVDLFSCKNLHFRGTVGLYAHVGPYLTQIACDRVGDDTEDIVVVNSGRNFSYLEQVCPVPVGTTALEVIVYGYISEYTNPKYDTVRLSLRVFDALY